MIYEDFMKSVEKEARKITSRYIYVAHLEYELVKTENFKKTFELTKELPADEYKNLVEKIRDSFNTCQQMHPATVATHGVDNYPIMATRSAVEVCHMAVAYSLTNFVGCNVQEPHIFLAIRRMYETNQGASATGISKCRVAADNSSIMKMFADYKVDTEEFFKRLVDVTADALGVEPSYSLQEEVAEKMGFGGTSKKNEDWHKFCTELVAKADEYKKPFIGREDIIDRTIQVLCRMDKSNPIHVGEPGVGKSAITIGLAKKLASGDVPKQLEGYKLYSVDLGAMVAGTKYRGEFEERITNLLKGAKEEGKCILFFDEMHTVVGAGSSTEGTLDASNILKPYLTDGDLKFIGATTLKEFKNRIEKDGALMRRFQTISVTEPSIADAIEILKGLRSAYEDYHGVTYTDDAIKTAVELTAKYVHDRFLPDKAIDIMDEAGAYQSIHNETVVTGEIVEEEISKLCRIPKQSFEKDDFKAVRELKSALSEKIYGQDNAIEKIVKKIKVAKAGLGDDDKPIGSFVFVGPTGTGKTELAKQLAKAMNIDFVRFDMSEYKEEHSISKFIGAPAGYVGYEDGGLLVEAIRKSPHCVLLLDEIEKAHPSIFDAFLQVLSNATLTDNKGRVADFKNVIIIMTSNVGARDAYSRKGFGFGASGTVTVDTNVMTEAYNRLFSPEFRNRISAVEFKAIDETVGKMVALKETRILNDKLAAKGVKATFTDDCINALVKKGVSPEYGAREIQRIIDFEIKVKLADQILNGDKKFKVDYKDDDFVVTAIKNKTAKDSKNLVTI